MGLGQFIASLKGTTFVREVARPSLTSPLLPHAQDAPHREQQGLEALGHADEIAAEVLGEQNGLTKGLRQLRAMLEA